MSNILVAGLYFSGSSAVIDLLKEYDCIDKIPHEFDDFRRKGLIGDYLEDKISSNYKCEINNHIRNLEFGIPTYASHLFPIQINKPSKIITDSCLRQRIELLKNIKENLKNSYDQKQKIRLANAWINDVKKIYTTASYTLFDQPIFTGKHSNTWPLVFAPYKLIVVYRSPKDQISQLIKENILFLDIETPANGISEIYGNTREAAIKYELDALKARFKNAVALQQQLGSNNVMIISFEDLVYKYEHSKSLIESFLNINSSSHTKRKIFFDPSVSKNNINIFKNHLKPDEINLCNDIESHLSYYKNKHTIK